MVLDDSKDSKDCRCIKKYKHIECVLNFQF